MDERNKGAPIGVAAMLAGVDRKTARKYLKSAKSPLEKEPRTWRTHDDKFAEVWPWVDARLTEDPDFDALTLFEMLCEEKVDQFLPSQLRSFQRGVAIRRAQIGTGKEAFFPQAHRPGEAAQVDFTDLKELSISVQGVQVTHLLCVFVLPYSNWTWVTLAVSESIMALHAGIQAALQRLGCCPAFMQTDNSTAATHRGAASGFADVQSEAPDGDCIHVRRRPFNDQYLAFMRHYAIEPRTTGVGKKEQNGDVEATNGAWKRHMEQALKVRGSREFESLEAFEQHARAITEKSNSRRQKRLSEELPHMHKLPDIALPNRQEIETCVGRSSTIRIKQCTYSVPSRLIGHDVTVYVSETCIEVYFANTRQLTTERLRGKNLTRIDYRHIIHSLAEKPGAFSRYIHREEMFPTVTFRRAYDNLVDRFGAGIRADSAYVQILLLASGLLQDEVEAAIALLIEDGHRVDAAAIRTLLGEPPSSIPKLRTLRPDLKTYDNLLMQMTGST